MSYALIIRQIITFVTFSIAAIFGIGLTILLAGGSKLLSVQSGSMSPAINKGDLVSVTPVAARDLRVGDIITFRSPDSANQTITHRIESIAGDMQGRITTKGDANAIADQALVPSQIIGRVDHIVPHAGYLVDWVRHPAGLLFFIYTPALVLIVSEFRHLAEYFRNLKPYSIGRRAEVEALSDLYIPSSL